MILVLSAFFSFCVLMFAISGFTFIFTESFYHPYKSHKKHTVICFSLIFSIIGFWFYAYKSSKTEVKNELTYNVNIVEGIPVYVNTYGDLSILESHYSVYDTVTVQELETIVLSTKVNTKFKIVDKKQYEDKTNS